MAGLQTMLHYKKNQKNDKQKNEDEDQTQDNMETVLLEAAITKIGHLLALGFGEAGSAIIAHNMTGEAELNPMTDGQRTYAVFGFTDIRHFAFHTEVLQTRIMTFVNQIAEIAHSQVDKYGGAANKNLGEAFLMMWKFPTPAEFKSRKPIQDMQISLDNRQIADMALFSFLKIICKINKYSHILEYRKEPGL